MAQRDNYLGPYYDEAFNAAAAEPNNEKLEAWLESLRPDLNLPNGDYSLGGAEGGEAFPAGPADIAKAKIAAIEAVLVLRAGRTA